MLRQTRLRDDIAAMSSSPADRARAENLLAELLDLQQQLGDLLLTALAEPASVLLGLDEAELGDRVRDRVPYLAHALTEEPDDVREMLAARLSLLLPERVDPAWWRTPLGGVIARAGRLTVPVAEAARVLGVTRARVYVLADEGKIARDGRGRVLLASVLDRLRSHPNSFGLRRPKPCPS